MPLGRKSRVPRATCVHPQWTNSCDRQEQVRLVRHPCTSSVSGCGLGMSKWSLTEIQLCAYAQPLAFVPSTFGVGHVANMRAFTENIEILPAPVSGGSRDAFMAHVAGSGCGSVVQATALWNRRATTIGRFYPLDDDDTKLTLAWSNGFERRLTATSASECTHDHAACSVEA